HEDRKMPGKARNKTKRYFLIRWEGFPPSEDTWEPEENLRGCTESLQEYWRTVRMRGRLTP
ncbi:MAG: chromo domain-containing protein, partial [Gaiellaceae bacterium]